MRFETPDSGDFDESELPPQFRDLIPLLRKWCIGDDALRCEKQQEASTEELQDLVEHVDPRLDQIDEYVRSRGSDWDEATSLLNCLAECVIEAQMELGLRAETKDFPE